MREPLLVVHSEPNDRGYYPVTFRGQEFALTTSPQIHWGSPSNPFGYDNRLEITVGLVEVPPAPKPKPKRKWSTAMGLRKPK